MNQDWVSREYVPTDLRHEHVFIPKPDGIVGEEICRYCMPVTDPMTEGLFSLRWSPDDSRLRIMFHAELRSLMGDK